MQTSSNLTHEQSVEQNIDHNQSDEHEVDSANTSVYAVWFSSSSSFLRVFTILVIWSFVISFVFSTAKRIGCINLPLNVWPLPPSGFRDHMILDISLVLTWLIPSDFISLFVWHFAFHSGRYIDFSTISGLKEFFADLQSCICCRRPCAAAARDESSRHTDSHTINRPISRHSEAAVKCTRESLFCESKSTEQSFASINNSGHQLSNEISESDYPEKASDQYNALLDVSERANQPNNLLIRRSKIRSIKRALTNAAAGRQTCRVQPLYWLTTPTTIYGVVWRNHVVSWFISLLVTVPWSLGGVDFADKGWLGLLIEKIFGYGPTKMIAFSNSLQLASEYLLLPMFYRKPIHMLRSSPVKKRRSIMLFSIVPLFLLFSQIFGVRGDVDEPPSCFFWCTVFPNFSVFMMTPLTSQQWPAAILIVFGVLSFLLLVDEIFHFGGCQPDNHHHCSCRWSYVLVLILLVSQSAGFITVVFAALEYFDPCTHIQLPEVVGVHALLVWWQLLVTSVAQKALPDLYADIIIFPVLLLDYFVSSLLFLLTPLFSALFFMCFLTQVGKAVVRDLSLFSRLYELSVGVVRRALRLPVAVRDIDSVRRKQLSRRIVRYQSFMVEICGKIVVVGALIVDAIPLYQDAPVLWTTFSPFYSTESAALSLEMMSALFVMILVHCFAHFVLMKVVDRLDRKELGNSTPNFPVFNEHWQRCFLFWMVCFTKFVPIVIVIFSMIVSGTRYKSQTIHHNTACEVPAIGLFGQPLASLTSCAM